MSKFILAKYVLFVHLKFAVCYEQIYFETWNFLIASSNIRNTEGDNFVMALICFLFENYVLFLYEMEQFKTVGDSFSQLCPKYMND